jgi:hypothetical protein
MAKFVLARDKQGRERMVPEHYINNDALGGYKAVAPANPKTAPNRNEPARAEADKKEATK